METMLRRNDDVIIAWFVFCCDVVPANIILQGYLTGNRMAWQWAETLVEIRGTLAGIRGTTK